MEKLNHFKEMECVRVRVCRSRGTSIYACIWTTAMKMTLVRRFLLRKVISKFLWSEKTTQEKLKSYKRLRALSERSNWHFSWSAKMGIKDKFISRCCRFIFLSRTQPILLSFVISSLHDRIWFHEWGARSRACVRVGCTSDHSFVRPKWNRIANHIFNRR